MAAKMMMMDKTDTTRRPFPWESRTKTTTTTTTNTLTNTLKNTLTPPSPPSVLTPPPPPPSPSMRISKDVEGSSTTVATFLTTTTTTTKTTKTKNTTKTTGKEEEEALSSLTKSGTNLNIKAVEIDEENSEGTTAVDSTYAEVAGSTRGDRQYPEEHEQQDQRQKQRQQKQNQKIQYKEEEDNRVSGAAESSSLTKTTTSVSSSNHNENDLENGEVDGVVVESENDESSEASAEESETEEEGDDDDEEDDDEEDDDEEDDDDDDEGTLSSYRRSLEKEQSEPNLREELKRVESELKDLRELLGKTVKEDEEEDQKEQQQQQQEQPQSPESQGQKKKKKTKKKKKKSSLSSSSSSTPASSNSLLGDNLNSFFYFLFQDQLDPWRSDGAAHGDYYERPASFHDPGGQGTLGAIPVEEEADKSWLLSLLANKDFSFVAAILLAGLIWYTKHHRHHQRSLPPPQSTRRRYRPLPPKVPAATTNTTQPRNKEKTRKGQMKDGLPRTTNAGSGTQGRRPKKPSAAATATAAAAAAATSSSRGRIRMIRDLSSDRLGDGGDRNVSQHHQPHKNDVVMLHIPSLPGHPHAEELLCRIRKEFLPILQRRGYNVSSISELCCCGDGLYDGLDTRHTSSSSSDQNNGRWKRPTANSNILGFNQTQTNGGGHKSHTIHLRLRRPENHHAFYNYDDIAGTMCHELAHCEIGPHNAAFYRLMDEIQEQHAKFLVNGIVSDRDGFPVGSDQAYVLGRNSGGLRVGDGSNEARALASAARAAMARQAQRDRFMPQGPQKLGSSAGNASAEEGLHHWMRPGDMAVLAAEDRKRKDDMWCQPCEPVVIELLSSDDDGDDDDDDDDDGRNHEEDEDRNNQDLQRKKAPRERGKGANDVLREADLTEQKDDDDEEEEAFLSDGKPATVATTATNRSAAPPAAADNHLEKNDDEDDHDVRVPDATTTTPAIAIDLTMEEEGEDDDDDDDDDVVAMGEATTGSHGRRDGGRHSPRRTPKQRRTDEDNPPPPKPPSRAERFRQEAIEAVKRHERAVSRRKFNIYKSSLHKMDFSK